MSVVILDTSAIVRFFVGDDPVKCEQVRILLKTETDIYIPDAVLVELEYVLGKLYNFSKEEILTVYDFLISQENIDVSEYVYGAVNVFRNYSVSFADSLIAVTSAGGTLASFDKKLLKVRLITPYWK